MRARPIHNRIFVRIDPAETQTKSGLWLPPGQKPKRMGEVLAVGPGMEDAKGKFIKTKLKAGDRVIFGAYAGATIKVNDEDVRVMRETDVVAAFEEGAEDSIQTGALESPREGAHSWYQ
jgi:chaperonin GroES